MAGTCQARASGARKRHAFCSPEPKRASAVLSEHGMQALLVADLDETLTGDAGALGRLLTLLERLGGRLGVAVATGRHLDSALECLDAHGIPVRKLVALSTSVGAELYLDGGHTPDSRYVAPFQDGWSRDAVRRVLDGVDGLEAQPEPDQRPLKVSYFVEDSVEVRARVEAALRTARLRVGTTFSQGRYLDAMPLGMSKASAAEYLARCFGLDADAVMTAGDSGNDTALLTSRYLATVVANHHTELEELRGTPRVYFARAGHADGVIEGLKRWRLV
jgi:sucrose-phosphate synthase